MNARRAAEEIFRAGVAAVAPDRLVRLALDRLRLRLAPESNLYVIGAGKSSAIMAKEVEAEFGERITAGWVVVKYGHACPLERIKITEAGHPTPDANGFAGAAEVLQLAQRAGERDLVLCLLSGGGSALLADCPEGSSPEDVAQMNRLLVRSGADISEINAVRKHLSEIKGGQLARAAQPARVLSLILSDVIGDPLDVIASGPTVPDASTFNDALAVIEKYGLQEEAPQSLLRRLREGAAGWRAETPKPGDALFENVQNGIIGNNVIALEACRKKAASLGFSAQVVTASLSGDSAAAVRQILEAAWRASASTCLIFGGETTLQVTGAGQGGRNQHLALAAAIQLADKPGITFLAAGTDGTDGPTDAAGAVVDSATTPSARGGGIDPVHCLKTFDSHPFFRRAGGHIITGPTLTNVMDIVIVLVER